MAYKSLNSITRSDIEALGISGDVSEKLLKDLDEIIHGSSMPPETWIQISRRILHPNLPFSFHQMMYYGCYKDFGPDPPAWLPDPYELLPLIDFFLQIFMIIEDMMICFVVVYFRKVASLTNVGKLLERRGKEFLGENYKNPISSFSSFQEFSVSNPEVTNIGVIMPKFL